MSDGPRTRETPVSRPATPEDHRLSAAVFGASGALVVGLDASGRITAFNPACETLTGRSCDDVRGSHFTTLLDPKEADAFPPVLESVLEQKRPAAFESHLVTTRGDRPLIAWSFAALADEDGDAGTVVGTGIEITEHSRTERRMRTALRDADRDAREMSAMVEAAQAVLRFHEFTPAARAIFDAARRMTGAAAGYVALLSSDGTENDVLFLESGGVTCTVDPSLAMPIRGLRAEAYRSNEPVIDNDFASSEWTQYLPDGHAPLENVLFAPLVVEGESAGLIGLANKPGGFAEDDVRLVSSLGELAAISLLNSRMFELLADSRERFRAVSETASDAIVCADSAGVITYWNPAAEAIFGHSADDAVGEHLTCLMPERYREGHLAGLHRVVTTGETRLIGSTHEIEGLRADGTEFPLELSLAQWNARDGVYFTAIIRDITERREQQAALAKAYENERRIAETLQEGLLPTLPEIPGLEIGALYQPAYDAELIGGDFYDAFELGGPLIALVVGDVAGKGVEAAGLTQTIRSATHALTSADSSPSDVLTRLNSILLERLPPGEFATMVLILIDTSTGEVRFGSAGHMPPIVCGDTNRVLEQPGGLPLGVQETTYEEGAFRLSPGERLVLYTDGLTEARRASGVLGEEGLFSLLSLQEATSPQGLAEGLLRSAQSFAENRLPDDVAILVARLSG